MAHSLYPNVYEPIRIGPVEVKNRLYQTPHGSSAGFAPPAYGLLGHIYAKDPTDGSPIPHPDAIDYYEERARGGVGLIIMGHIEVQKGDSGRWHLTTQGGIDAFKPLTERVRSHGTKIMAQLHCGFGSPSGLPGAGFVGDGFPKPLTQDDLHRITALVGLSAANAREAGFDGVELHAAHLHSTGMFLSGFTNRRTDEYGGNVENRMRWLIECLQSIRDATGDSIAVGLRMPCDEELPNGIDAEEACEIVRRFEATKLLDFFDLDIGHSQHMWQVWAPHYLPASYQVPYIAKVRAAIQNAVVLGCPGRLSDPAEAERIIESGAMDMVGGVRGLYADPEFPRKGLEMRAEEIRPCIGLSSCTYEGQCVMNPTNYLEALYGVMKMTPTQAPKRVVVVGGGPAGMEAARMAALRGHSVTLLERAGELGGALNLHAKLPTREGVLKAASWWSGRLDALGVKVLLHKDATVDAILAHDPEVVVIATGATFDRTGVNGLTGNTIPGWEQDFVHTPESALANVPAATRNVVVYEEDGAITGSDLALLFALNGAANVHHVTRHAATAQNYLGRPGSHRDLVNMRLREQGVHMAVETFIRDIGDHEVTLYDIRTGAPRTVPDVDVVVLVTLRRPNDELVGALRAKVADVRVLGDANTPGRMAKATRDGFFFGWNL
jgi:2,4-dienoyl-CoA reductase-like NADH-dependent reductase (Old Yellow Enzyme family)/NADPH-dependent 2,4-dienoyl-CoA reductase/sulfur reductase-like enzyme